MWAEGGPAIPQSDWYWGVESKGVLVFICNSLTEVWCLLQGIPRVMVHRTVSDL